jgi:hypothetical protein
MRTLEQKFRTMYQGDLYTVIMKGNELITAYYEDNNKVGSPSLLHNLEYYLSTGLYSF